MQKEFVIPVVSIEGKQMRMEIKQKNIQVTKRRVKTWNSDEDNQLIDLYEKFPKRWSEIAAFMTDRNENQCLHRYRRLSQLGKGHKIWSSEQDEAIKKLIKKFGKNWKLISEMLGTKNGKQIRERFINKLDPKIKKEDWSDEEDRKIIEFYSKIGSKWSQISKHLPGRPQNKIKNRFYSYIQKNYEIKFKEVEAISSTQVEDTNFPKESQDAHPLQAQKQPLSQNFGIKSLSLIDQNGKCSKPYEQKMDSKFAIPSINEIDFQQKNDRYMSYNLLDSIIRVEDEWRSTLQYSSIIDFQSNDLLYKLQN